MDEAVKISFLKVKQDMQELRDEIRMLKEELQALTSLVKSSLLTKSSTGNEGVPTDRQTDRQTDTPTHFIPENIQYPENKTVELDIQKAADILDSLNTLKKQIRHKFKHLTNQEMLVFSTIYQLEEQNPESVTYKEIALKLHLSESSIRDYVQRIINKGIPIKKYKINNKKLILSISQDLKRVATLSTIIKLREL